MWLLLAFRLDGDSSGSEQAGYVTGWYFGTFLIALAVRGVYYAVRGRKIAFWSPWVFVIAAAIGLLAKLPDAAEALKQEEQVERVAAQVPGKESEDVRDCIEGGVAHWGEATPEERAEVPRDVYEKLIGRACAEAERRGLFEKGEVDQAQLTAIVEEIVAEMRANGEI